MKMILSIAIACSVMNVEVPRANAMPFPANGARAAPSIGAVTKINHWRYRDRWCCGPSYYPSYSYAPRAYGYYYPPAAYYPPPIAYYPPRYYAPPIAYEAYDYGYVVHRGGYYDGW
jgi:hypothetical protein